MLHGQVEINHHVIMEYQITNEGQLFTETDDSDHTTYQFIVWGTDKGGYTFHYDFLKDVLTKDNRGAHDLIAVAMTELGDRMKERVYF